MTCRPRLTEATYTVEIRDRRTGMLRCVIESPTLTGTFGRRLDETSEASVTVSTSDECCPCAGKYIERRDELVIRRSDGQAEWIGPLLTVIDDQANGSITFAAADRSWWWHGAPFASLLAHVEGKSEADPATIWQELIDIAEAYEPSGLTFGVGPHPGYGVTIPTAYEAGHSVWTEMTSLAESFIDWTVVGDRYWWGAREIDVADGPTLRYPAHWASGGVTIERDASQVATRVAVIGANGVVGYWPTPEQTNIYGKRTLFVEDSTVNTAAEATAVAQFVYLANDTPGNYLTTGSNSLSTDAPVCLHDLVPGRKFTVESTSGCLRAVDSLRLSAVDVTFKASIDCRGDRAIRETAVSVDFQRLGVQSTTEVAANG